MNANQCLKITLTNIHVWLKFVHIFQSLLYVDFEVYSVFVKGLLYIHSLTFFMQELNRTPFVSLLHLCYLYSLSFMHFSLLFASFLNFSYLSSSRIFLLSQLLLYQFVSSNLLFSPCFPSPSILTPSLPLLLFLPLLSPSPLLIPCLPHSFN